MTHPLVHRRGFIRVPVWIRSGLNSANFEFAVDTGASHTVLDRTSATILGLTQFDRRTPIVTVTRTEQAGVASVSHISTLGRQRQEFPVLIVDVPSSAGIDGLLGLDFLADGRLALDFANRLIQLDD